MKIGANEYTLLAFVLPPISAPIRHQLSIIRSFQAPAPLEEDLFELGIRPVLSSLHPFCLKLALSSAQV